MADELSLDITYLPQFREVNNGLLAGMEKSEAYGKFPGKFCSILAWAETLPEGESLEGLFYRIKGAWYNLKNKLKREMFYRVTHGGIINILLCLENRIAHTNKEIHFQITNAQIVEVDI